MAIYCINCGQVQRNGMWGSKCKHPAGHKVRESAGRKPPKPLQTANNNREVARLQYVANANKLMKQALFELQQARDINDCWDLEFAQRGLRTQIYFLENNAKL